MSVISYIQRTEHLIIHYYLVYLILKYDMAPLSSASLPTTGVGGCMGHEYAHGGGGYGGVGGVGGVWKGGGGSYLFTPTTSPTPMGPMCASLAG